MNPTIKMWKNRLHTAIDRIKNLDQPSSGPIGWFFMLPIRLVAIVVYIVFGTLETIWFEFTHGCTGCAVAMAALVSGVLGFVWFIWFAAYPLSPATIKSKLEAFPHGQVCATAYVRRLASNSYGVSTGDIYLARKQCVKSDFSIALDKELGK